MFKPRNKKKHPVVLKPSHGDDEDVEETTSSVAASIISLPKKKKSKLGTSGKSKQSALSFQNEEEEEEDFTLPLLKRKKRKGMGFGGIVADKDQGKGDDNRSASNASMYGTDALKELKASQKYTLSGSDQNKTRITADIDKVKAPKIHEYVDKHEIEVQPHNIEELEQIVTSASKLNDRNDNFVSGNDYIPLESIKTYNERVLAGEEALNFNLTPSEKINSIIDSNEDIDDWESELMRRGMRTSAVSNENLNLPTTQQSIKQRGVVDEVNEGIGRSFGYSGLESYEKISSAIKSAILRIQDTKSQLRSSIRRREAELSHVRVDKERLVKEVNEMEEMSKWALSARLRLANWIGALRDLDEKLHKIENTILCATKEHNISVETRQRQFEDDLMSFLDENSLLKSSVGRAIVTRNDESANLVSVDEFGRNMPNRLNIEKAYRQKRRMFVISKLKDKSKDRSSLVLVAQEYGHLSDAEASDDERECLKQQKETLSTALKAAVSGTNEFFLSIQGVLEFLQEWRNAFPDQFLNCKAQSGFSELLRVLVRYEFLDRYHVLWNLSGSMGNTFDVECFSNLGGEIKSTEAKVLLTDVLQKELYLYLMSTVQDAYNVHSEHQTIILTRVYDFLAAYYLKNIENHTQFDTLNNCIIQKLSAKIKDMLIPIPNLSIFEVAHGSESCFNDNNLDLVIMLLTQLYRIEKVVLNICKFWAPLFVKHQSSDIQKKIAQIIFIEGISLRLLPVLTHMRESSSINDMDCIAKSILSEIYSEIKSSLSNWLHNPDFMLFTSPLRASVEAFNIE